MDHEITEISSQHSLFPKIIINADDYGYSWQRSKGILELLNQQHISSISVIINAPQIQQKCQILKQSLTINLKNKLFQQSLNNNTSYQNNICYSNQEGSYGLSIGLHLNITQFSPCTQLIPDTYLPILDKTAKTFKGKQYIYTNLNIFSQNPHLSQFLQTQIRSQIQQFIKIFKCKPSHLDSHNHIHIIPSIAHHVCSISRLFGIYKIRMPIPYKIDQIQNNPTLNTFNNQLIALSLQSKHIYQKYGFISPTYLLGLDTMGTNLTPQKISAKMEQILKQTPKAHLPQTSIQLMVHPGYKQQHNSTPYPTCPFNQSSQRQHQLQVLKSKQFHHVIKNYQLSSYLDLNNQEKSQKSVLIYSKLILGCGNLTTSLRISTILEQQLSFKVYFVDQPTIQTQNQISRIQLMIQQLAIKLIIGVNLTRTANIIYQATNKIKNFHVGYCYKIPYILVIAGTDANITLNGQNPDKNKLQQINTSIQNCLCLISISNQMKNKISNYLSIYQINKDIICITQSTLNQNYQNISKQSLSHTNQSSPSLTNSKQPQYIIFPTSFRKVKSVDHILPQLNTLIQKHKIRVYLVGPIISRQYYTLISPQLKNIQYLGCISHQRYLNLLRNAIIMINTSQSQGMSCSILEAFAQRVPVIARNNQGNCQLIADGNNGYLYSTGQEFIKKFQILYYNSSIKNAICQRAYQLVNKNFSYQRQVMQYKQMINKYYQPMVYKLDISQIVLNQQQSKKQKNNQFPQLFFLSIKNVHPISKTNLKIFSKFYKKLLNTNYTPADLYLSKILNIQQKTITKISILDICCGNGIFGIYFITNLIPYLSTIQKQLTLNLYFTDIDQASLDNLSINIKTFQHLISSSFNKTIIIQSITILKSNMFQSIPQNQFDIILANPPQFPFNSTQSCLDKNGGQQGDKYMNILLTNYHKYLKNKYSFLLILYSYIGNPNKFTSILQSTHNQIKWIGQNETHQISKLQLQQMQNGITTKIQLLMKQGKNNITINQLLFFIPAQLRIIQQK